MEKEQANVRVDAVVKEAVEGYCKPRGVAVNHFVQEALLDRIEESEDIEDLKKIRHEPTRPLADVLGELGIDGPGRVARGRAETGGR